MNSGMFEITHDSLAAKIWEKVSAEEKTLMEVRNFISNSAAIYRSRKVLLTKQDLAYIAPYESKLTLDEDTKWFIGRSKRFYRNQKISTIGILALIITALVIGIIIVSNANKKAITEKNRAELAQLNAEKEKENALKEKTRAEGAEEIAVKERENALKEKTRAEGAEEKALRESENTLREKERAIEAEKKALREKDTALQAKRKADTLAKNLTEQKVEIQKTLENTKQLSENPTLALKQAITLYDNIDTANKDLRLQLKKNAFEAYNQVFYVAEKRTLTQISDIAISYDGKSVLIADGTIIPKVWNEDFNPKNNLTGHLDLITSVAASPNGPHFITIEKYREAIFWGNDFKYVDTAIFKDDIKTVKYINEGKEVLIGFKNGKMAITDLRGKILYNIFESGVIGLEEMEVTKQPGYNFFTRSSDDKIRRWTKKENSNIFESKVVFENNRSIREITAMAISPGADKLLLATEKGIYSADSLKNKNIYFQFEIFFPAITNIVFKTDHKVIISTAKGLVFIYDLESKEYNRLQGYEQLSSIKHVLTIPNSNRFITIGDDRRLLVWDDYANKSFLYRSQEYNSEKINDTLSFDKKINKWIFKGIPGDMVYFKKSQDTIIRPYSGGILKKIEWIKPDKKNDPISITSEPVAKYGLVYNESALIRQNNILLSIINIDKLTEGDNKKLSSKLSISSIAISECGKFILIKCIQASGKYTYYYIYPTFNGLKYLVKEKNLLNLR